MGLGIIATVSSLGRAIAHGHNGSISDIPLIVGLIMLAGGFVSLLPQGPTTVRWNTTSIRDYLFWDNSIPDFVLASAIRAKKACPAGNIEVEYLTETKDPFLRITVQTGQRADGYETFYLEVWDEKDFERTL